MSTAPASPLRKKRRLWLRLLVVVGLLFVVLSGGTLTYAYWLGSSEAGFKKLAVWVTRFSGGRVVVDGVSGTLNGAPAISRLRLDLPKQKIDIADIKLQWTFADLWSRKLTIQRLRAGSVDIFLKASEDEPYEPPELPQTLRLPWGLAFDAVVELGAVSIYGKDFDEPGADSRLYLLDSVIVSAKGGAERYALRQVSARLPHGQLEATGGINASRPFVLEAKLSLVANDASYQLDVEARGILAEPTLTLRGQGAGLDGRATLVATPFNAVPARAVELAIKDFNPAILVPASPTMHLSASANLAVSGSNKELALTGPLVITNTAPTTLDKGGIPVAGLQAQLTGNVLGVSFEQLVIEGGGGQLKGRGEINWGLPINLSLDLVALNPAKIHSQLPVRRVNGRIEANMAENMHHGKLTLDVDVARINAEGKLGADHDFSVDLNLKSFDPAAFVPGSPKGAITLNARVAGVMATPARATVNFTFGPSVFNGGPLAGEGALSWDGTHIHKANASFVLAGNRIKASGAWGKPTDQLDIEVDAPRLAGMGFGFGGKLTGQGALTGGLETPAGHFKISAQSLFLPGGVAIGGLEGAGSLSAAVSGPLTLNLRGSGISVGDLRLDAANIEASGRRDEHLINASLEGRYAENADKLSTTLAGGFKKHDWVGHLTRFKSAGQWPVVLTAPATLELSPDKVYLGGAEFTLVKTGKLTLSELRWAEDDIVLRGTLTGLPLNLISALEQGRRDPLTIGGKWDVRVGQTLEGQVDIFRESGDFRIKGEMSTRIGMERLEAHLSARDNKLQLSLAASAREAGELAMNFAAGVERFGTGWRLTPQAPLAGRARLSMPSIAWMSRMFRDNIETAGKLSADVSIAGTAASPSLVGNINGKNLQLSFVDQGLILGGGELQASLRHQDGTQSLALEKLSFVSPNRVKPADKRVPYKELTQTPGRLDVTGNVVLGSSGTDISQRGKFVFKADRLPILQRSDRWLILSGDGTVSLLGQKMSVDAWMRTDAGYFADTDAMAPSLGDDVHIIGKDDGSDAQKTAAAASPLQVSGKVDINLGRAIYLDAFGVDTRLAGHLSLLLRPSKPIVAEGVIRTVGGTYRGYGQRLDIERGTLTFNGEVGNPGLNILAMRRGMEVDAGVAIGGDARKPQVRLVSEPTVPDAEKLAWLILGHAPDKEGSELSMLLPAAQALLGGAGGGVAEELTRKMGIDIFSIGQGDLNSYTRGATSRVVGAGSRTNSGPTVDGEVISVGKRLANDLILSFEQGLSGAESLVKLTYRLNRQFSLVARGGTDNALDLYYTCTFADDDKRSKLRREKRKQERRKALTARTTEVEAETRPARNVTAPTIQPIPESDIKVSKPVQ